MKPIYAPISIHSGANGQYQDYPRLCHITGYRAIRIGIKIAALLSFLPFCICPPLCAQEPIPTFSFCTIIDQSMVIDGGSLQFAYIHEVAINDAAEVAFVASRFDGMETDKQGIVYTSRHRIARTGDVKDGWYLAFIDKDAHIAINAKGDVAYEAWYSATKERAAAGAKALGIFINDRLALLLGRVPTPFLPTPIRPLRHFLQTASMKSPCPSTVTW
jgi:hypothetical protein